MRQYEHRNNQEVYARKQNMKEQKGLESCGQMSIGICQRRPINSVNRYEIGEKSAI